LVGLLVYGRAGKAAEQTLGFESPDYGSKDAIGLYTVYIVRAALLAMFLSPYRFGNGSFCFLKTLMLMSQSWNHRCYPNRGSVSKALSQLTGFYRTLVTDSRKNSASQVFSV